MEKKHKIYNKRAEPEVKFMKKPLVCCVTLTTYLNAELFSFELKGQVLVVRKLTGQAVQVRYLVNVKQACE